MDFHDLTAGYALDALDADERARYEEHLATCESCREELEAFWGVTGSLALVAAGPAPRPALRERILEQARSERPNVVPLRPRRAFPVFQAATAVAALAALAVGIWGASVARDLDRAESELSVLRDPNARTLSTAGGEADLVVTPSGEAALVVRKLAPAPEGKDYEIWVIADGTPRRAGLFEGPGVALLDRRVGSGQAVAVTLERDGGVDAPTTDPLFATATT